jgi:hypothetical protein
MKRIVVLAGILMLAASFAWAAAPQTYQVTGPVLEIKDDTITVQKGNEKWEIAKDASTKMTGDVKVGSKVTIQYMMKATEIESKEAPKKAEKPAKEAPKKK